MRHLFNATLDEVWTWTEDRWLQHKAFADLWLERNNIELRG